MTRAIAIRKCGGFLLALFFLLITAHSARAQNPIVTENALPGNPKSEWDISGAGDLSIQGFATDISVNKGGTVRFKIDSDGGASFSIRIYRLGYYQGNGARLITNLGTFSGTSQPNPNTNTTTGLVECSNWSESASWVVPSTAVSGIYIAKLTRTSGGGSSHIVFIVRDDAGNAPMLFKTSDATWQAYNNYGGNSLYNGATSFPSGHAAKVSYDRPFLTRNGGGGGGAMEDWLFNAEYPMIRFLERNGYHISYTTDVDMERDATPITPAKHKVLLSVGHDEYWSMNERVKFENARNAGVHLAFFSGNEVYWKTRWENNNRTLVCYKEGNLGENVCGNKCDPSPVWTGLWREGGAYDAGLPENALTGQISWELVTAAITVPGQYKNLRFWRGTSVAQQADNGTITLPNGTLGYEADFEQYEDSYPSGRITLSSTNINGKVHKLSLYRHASGALVFGAGTVQWSWGLDNIHDRGSAAPSVAMQQATVNLFADMGVQPATLMAGLTAATASTDFTAPTVTISSPAHGTTLATGSQVTISGTASDAGGVLVGVEISVDGGNTWQAVNGTANWTFSWTPVTPGPASIRVRGFDDSGNMGVPGSAGSSSHISVNVGGTGPVCPCTIFSPSDAPGVQLDYDGQSIEVGTKFRSTQSGYITALRFYKGAGNSGTHIGHLWSSDGTMLAEATFINESPSGWQQVNLSNPIAITANTTYIVSYFSSSGYYSSSNPYFGSPVVNGYLRALASGEDGPNGVYAYSNTPTFPASNYQTSNYWVDVVFDPSAVVDAIPPTVNLTAPTGGIVSGEVEVMATASDNIGVAGVQFQLNGINLGAEDLSAPFEFTWNTLAHTNGNYALTAIARDGSGNKDTSNVIAVTINNGGADTEAPSVNITSPAAGTVAGTINVDATAIDNISVVGVQFLLDGVNFQAEDIVAPYSVSWNTTTATNGPHILTARARDAAGNTTLSTAIVVNVNNTNLVLALAFNENTGSTAIDQSGNNNNGTLVNGATWNATGRFGAAASFDGSNDMITIPDANSLDLTNGMTVEAWIRPTNLSGYKTILCKDRTSSAFSYVLSANNSALLSGSQRPNARIRIGSNTRTVTGTSKLSTNTWTHVATTYNGSTLRLYINGVQVSSLNTTGNMTVSSDMLRIGGSPSLGSQYFAGLIDEVRVYNRALSQAEIQADMNTPIGADAISPTVVISSPAEGAVSGTINITATAADNIGVAGVQFKVNGVNLGAEDLEAPYEIPWNTTTLTNGNYTLTATARDATGNSTTSAGTVVTVTNIAPDTDFPIVSLTAPAAGEVNGTVTINANATDNIGVAGVQFIVNGVNHGAEDLVAPYSISWNTVPLPNGQYTLTARARDAAGNVTTSGQVIVSVNNVPDTEAPSVTITSPTGGTVAGNVNVTVNATDNVSVAGVELWVNGIALGSEDQAAPYNFILNTSTMPNGAYNLSAKARDVAGNVDTSAIVEINVNNTKNLIVALPFNEASGTTALDISGNNHNGVLTNGPGRSNGKFERGVDFDGVNDYVNIADHQDFTLDPTQSYTWSGWVRSDNFNQWNTVWSQTVDHYNVLQIYAHTTQDVDGGPVTNGLSVFWWLNEGTTKLVAHSTNNVLSIGVWSYVTITYDAAQVQNNRFTIYVNGTDVTNRSDVASSGVIGTINPNNIRIGANEPYGEYFAGSIDEFRFYRSLLNVSDILLDMNTALIAGPDVIAPFVSTATPANGAIGIPLNTTITALFNEPVNPATVTSANFEVRNALNVLVPGTVSYNAGTLTATFTPSSPLTLSTEYFVRIKSGTGGIKDLAGNAMSADFTWSFTSTTPPPPPPNDGPGGPILVISTPANPFSRYAVEILRAEGLNEFKALDLSQVNATVLNSYDVVILGEMPLSAANVTMFTNWVNTGGKLIAFKPDAQLNSLMGISAAGGTLSDQYLLVNTASGPGAGIVNQTMQFHGTANRYTLNGATSLATLYSGPNTATTNPAVTRRSVGSNGGMAICFAYDLARSIVYTRQGNPSQAALDSDANAPIRPNDLFFPDYVNLDKVAIPQADEQQRLLANIIIQSNLSKKPLPRFWYMPKGYKAAVIFALDDHGTTNGTINVFNKMVVNSTPGCSVDAWECARATSWYYLGIPFTNGQAINFHNQGFEVGRHVENGCTNFNATSLNSVYTTQLQEFRSEYPGVPNQQTHRFHCIVWSDWATQAKVGLTHGIRFSLDYYYWPSTWVNGRPGLFTGSGMPMRFADVDGSLIDVYQGVSQIVNENGINYTIGTNVLLDNALGPQGYYGMFGAHDDYRDAAFSDEVIASAKARGVPLITAQQALTWTDGRNNSSFGDIQWNNNTLTFTVAAASGAKYMKGMLPASTGTNNLISLLRNGVSVPFTLETIKGMTYAFFDATTGSYTASYSIDITPPSVISTVPANAATEISTNVNVTATFNESMNPSSITGNVELRNPSDQLIPATVTYNAANNTVTLAPTSILVNNTVYTVRVMGGGNGVKDISGNALASNYSWSFATTVGDIIAPLITATTPAHGATGVSTSPVVAVTFNETMDGSTINGSTFELRNSLNNLVPSSVNYSPGSRTAALAPSVALAGSSTYTVIIKGLAGGIKDSAGNALASDSIWSFTTNAGDVTAPLIVSTSPINGATGISIQTDVSAGFNEAMDPSTINGASIELRNPSNNLVSSTIIYNSETRTVFLTPLSNLANGTVYTVRIRGGVSGVKDITGNGLIADSVWSFTTDQGDVTAPLVNSVLPVNGASSVSTGTTLVVVFNEPMNAATINTSTIEVRNPSDVLVPATVTFNAETNTATLTPSAALANATAYTATVRGQATGVQDVAGNALASNHTWSFTTVEASSTIVTIFAPTSTPGSQENDGAAVEVGMKFRANVNGQVMGLRYYKGTTFTTGTRIGHLWSSTGNLIASATFINETASGWQQVLFTTPVNITAGTTYIAAYHSSGGHYTVTNPFFTSAATNGPLRGLVYGEDGPNGVYKYSPTPVFPNDNYGSSNYWVDVVFVPDGPIARVSQPASTTTNTQAPLKLETPLMSYTGNLSVTVHPNPGTGYFNIKIQSGESSPVSIRIVDALGQIIENRHKIAPNGTLRIGDKWNAGTYIAEVIQGEERRIIKIIKLE